MCSSDLALQTGRSALPFAGILLSIALFPLAAPTFWHHHFPKVSAAWAAVLVVPFVLAHGGPALHEIAHTAIVDYIPFIILLATLFTVGGGIYVRGSGRALEGGGRRLRDWFGRIFR